MRRTTVGFPDDDPPESPQTLDRSGRGFTVRARLRQRGATGIARHGDVIVFPTPFEDPPRVRIRGGLAPLAGTAREEDDWEVFEVEVTPSGVTIRTFRRRGDPRGLA